MAIVLGVVGGLADARAGRPPYLYALLLRRDHRRALMKSGLETAVNLLLMGVLLEAVFQWVILGNSHPGAALVVGPASSFFPTRRRGLSPTACRAELPRRDSSVAV
jgi:hypothetical protein